MKDTQNFYQTLSRIAPKILVLLLVLLFPALASAASIQSISPAWCSIWGIRCGGTSPVNSLWSLMWSVIMIALSFVAIIAAGFLVYYGFLYIISRGEEDSARRAKAGIAYALIGVIIAGLASWLVNAIINI